MESADGRSGPFRWLANVVAEKIADFLLGGDVLAPGREGSEVDWEELEDTMSRKVTAILPRIQLELALLAADRRTEGGLKKEAVKMLISKAADLGEGESSECEPSDDCRVTLTGKNGSDLELEMSGKGRLFETLRNEIWDRAKSLETEVEED